MIEADQIPSKRHNLKRLAFYSLILFTVTAQIFDLALDAYTWYLMGNSNFAVANSFAVLVVLIPFFENLMLSDI